MVSNSYDYKIVERGTVAVGYIIEQYKWEDEDEPKYSWRAGDGDEPDQWFDTADEALDDLRSRYGG